MATPVNPYGFYEYDWHMMLWQSVYNMALPAALYGVYTQVFTSSTAKTSDFVTITLSAAAVWGPLLLIGFLTELVDAFAPLASFYLEHVISNLAPINYIASAFILQNLILDEPGWESWMYVILYGIGAAGLSFLTRFRGTFAIYWLNPQSKHLDSMLYPSLMYILGLRSHRWRYYTYFPAYAPVFDV